MAGNAVARRGVSIALACRTFGVSETCFRYSPRLSDENERIADLLVGLTPAKRRPGDLGCTFCICAMCRDIAGTTNGSIASTARRN